MSKTKKNFVLAIRCNKPPTHVRADHCPRVTIRRQVACSTSCWRDIRGNTILKHKYDEISRAFTMCLFLLSRVLFIAGCHTLIRFVCILSPETRSDHFIFIYVAIILTSNTATMSMKVLVCECIGKELLTEFYVSFSFKCSHRIKDCCWKSFINVPSIVRLTKIFLFDITFRWHSISRGPINRVRYATGLQSSDILSSCGEFCDLKANSSSELVIFATKR